MRHPSQWCLCAVPNKLPHPSESGTTGGVAAPELVWAVMCVCAQISALTALQDLRLKVREIDAEGVRALRTLTALRALDLEARALLWHPPPPLLV